MLITQTGTNVILNMTWQARPISTHPLQFSLHSAKASCSLVCRDPTDSNHSLWHFLAGQVVVGHCRMSFISCVRLAAHQRAGCRECLQQDGITHASSLATSVQTLSQLVSFDVEEWCSDKATMCLLHKASPIRVEVDCALVDKSRSSHQLPATKESIIVVTSFTPSWKRCRKSNSGSKSSTMRAI
jgi:hypothetical protein